MPVAQVKRSDEREQYKRGGSESPSSKRNPAPLDKILRTDSLLLLLPRCSLGPSRRTSLSETLCPSLVSLFVALI